MLAPYILSAVALVMIGAAATRGFKDPKASVWLTVAAIFVLVSVWLVVRG